MSNPAPTPAMEDDASSPMRTDVESSVVHVMMDDDAAAILSMVVTPRHSVVGRDATMSTTQVCVSVNAGDLPDDGKRAPVDLIVALDCSGSMEGGGKLELCKTTLELIIRFLLPTDRFGLISFASKAIVEVPAQKMSAENKQRAIDKVKSLVPCGGTDISAAIGLAAQQMKRIEEPNEVRTIFLLTDGLANEGVTDAVGMVELTKNCLLKDSTMTHFVQHVTTLFDRFFKRGNIPNTEERNDSSKAPNKNVPTGVFSSELPITLHCFGYGNDHDSDLLSTLARSATPGGIYYFVENDKSLGATFGDALGGVLSVVAQSTVVNISIPPDAAACGVTIVDVFHDRKVKREDGSYSVMIGDFYAEESRDVVFEIKLAACPVHSNNKSNPTPWMPHVAVSISYTDTLQKQPVTLSPVTCFISRPLGSEISEESKHVVIQWLRIVTTNQMDVARRLCIMQKHVEARSVIEAALCTVSNAQHVQSDPLIVQLTKDLKDVQEGLTWEQNYEQCVHFAQSSVDQHRMQRSAGSNATSAAVYRGTKKTQLTRAFNLN